MKTGEKRKDSMQRCRYYWQSEREIERIEHSHFLANYREEHTQENKAETTDNCKKATVSFLYRNQIGAGYPKKKRVRVKVW